MTLPVVAVTRALPANLLAPLQDVAELRVAPPGDIEPIDLQRLVTGATAIISTLNESIDTDVLTTAGPRLRVVANVAAGYDNLDLEAITDAGAIATNTPAVLTDATADLTVALLLSVSRRIVEGDRLIRSGHPWKWDIDFLLGASLQGKTLGIVGMGAIGQAVAQRAKAFGMKVVHTGRRSMASVADSTPVELSELLDVADFVSLHCPLTPDKHHLFNETAFAQMRPTAFLINTARGSIVEEKALLSALQKDEIAGAALDVFEFEPDMTDELRERSDVVLTPHLGSATVETRTEMVRLAVENVLAVLKGNPAVTPIF